MNQLLTIVIFTFLCLWNNPIQGIAELPWNGVDASELTQVKKGGATFYQWSENDNWGWETPVPKILAYHGVNVARLRLLHSPEDGVNGLDYTLDLAQRLHDEGIGIFLNFHFSDSWADPVKQTKPTAWKDKYIETILQETVRDYVSDVIKAFISRGITLVGVQFGNETPGGMMWPNGKVGDSYDTPEQWWNLGELFQYVRQGLELAYFEGTPPKVVVHLDHGGNKELYSWFFGNLIAQGVQFDVIGVSSYPGWNGNLSDLKANLKFCINEFGKDVVVIETSYAWTLEGYNSKMNIVGMENQLQEGYPATKEGQAKWLYDVTVVVAGLPNNRGLGVMSWGATWVTSKGFESPWENQALFDAWGYPNPALDALWWN